MLESSKTMRRRILMLIPELGFGGAERSFLHLAQSLSEFHDVSLVVFKLHYASGDYSKEENDIALPLAVLDSDKNLGRFGRWLNRWRQLRTLKRNADVTISFLTGANILNVVSGGPGRKVVSMRGSRRYDPALNRIKLLFYEHFIDPLTFKFSDCVVSISKGLSAELRSNVDSVTKKKIKTIGLFYDAERLIASSNETIENEMLALKGLPIVVSVGRLSQEKGFQYLINVFANVRLSIPDAKLLLIGDGPLYQPLIEMCQTLNLSVSDGESKLMESSVVFLGYRSNPCRYFRVAKLFVSSSLTEGFSNVIVEALAAGVPVLATDCPWGPRSILWKEPANVSTPYPTEYPTHADYGVLMPRIDRVKFQQVWVDGLTKYLSQPHIIDKYVNKGFERVYELDSKRVLHSWLDVVDELCEPQSSSGCY